MPFALNYAARSDVGLVRSENQDSAYAGQHLLVVADGMGGHAGGDIASSTAIGYLVELDEESLNSNETGDELARAIAKANAELQRIATARPELQGMGTTVTALLRSRHTLVVAHIGDSRAYLLRGGELAQITTDHTFVQTLVDSGRISADEAGSHPQRLQITGPRRLDVQFRSAHAADDRIDTEFVRAAVDADFVRARKPRDGRVDFEQLLETLKVPPVIDPFFKLADKPRRKAHQVGNPATLQLQGEEQMFQGRGG